MSSSRQSGSFAASNAEYEKGMQEYQQDIASRRENAVSLATLYRQQPPTTRQATKHCTICCTKPVEYTIFERYHVCYPCGECLLSDLAMEHNASLFEEHDTQMRAAIAEGEKQEKIDGGLPFSAPGSPVDLGLDESPVQWPCAHCTFLNEGAAAECQVCGIPKPTLYCSMCLLDTLQHPVCKVTKKPHETWECQQCHARNLDKAVECRSCRAKRSWFCGRCSLENHYYNDSCEVCGGVDKVGSLSFIKRKEELEGMGLSLAEAELERQQSTSTALGAERLKNRILKTGCSPIQISDDGNCLFRALGFQLFRDESCHLLLRRMIVNFLQENSDEFCMFIGSEEFPAYIAEMSKDKVWGDEPCVRAASRLFQCTTHLLTSDESRWHLKYKIYGGIDPAPGRHIFLAYISPVHYYTFVLPKDVQLPPLDLERECQRLAPDVRPIARQQLPQDPSLSPGSSGGGGGLSGPGGPGHMLLRVRSFSQESCRYFPASSIPNLVHPVVVVIRLDTTQNHIVVPSTTTGGCVPSGGGGDGVASIDRHASRFYLHFGGTIRKSKTGPIQPTFYLQDVISGHFLAPQPKFHEGRIKSSRVHLRPMDLARRKDFAITVENKVNFVFIGEQSTRYWGWVPNSSTLLLTEEKLLGCYLRFVLLFDGRKERLCKKCRVWYDGSNSATSRAPGSSPQNQLSGSTGCVHVSDADAAHEMIRKAQAAAASSSTPSAGSSPVVKR